MHLVPALVVPVFKKRAFPAAWGEKGAIYICTGHICIGYRALTLSALQINQKLTSKELELRAEK